ncbi:putative quinol monooxygenase [Pseudohoeflea coraliihabitans]|uniref:Antibiotic biosynthesis monooxygenase n=1 Tax=Pseudohoeflea coraliihabitans TaxID=2860393 RepID=A0ABS6WPR8_9HYPH|nr:putative quinol monooxygenase [Pseudohoeflea sp. DP4N28-3]MBW3097971.1 antibiotic biosynthesis monooxygenase [Pseudohoeflea sp. DP4N28-3]
MGKARLLVELDIKPNAQASFAEMFQAQFIARSRREDGCERYELWREADNPARMTIIEVWSSQQALDAHLAQAWFAEWAPKMEAALSTPLVIRTMVSVED